MINDPIYDEKIIVGVIYNNIFNWYVTDKTLWIMDYTKMHKNDCESYFSNQEINAIRKDIKILSENNIELFLEKIKYYKVNVTNLRLKILNKIMENNKENELEDFYPVLLLDFDKKILYSQYPEPFAFENYVPDNWEGKYISFIDFINDENKYWIYKNKNFFI